MVGLVIVSHSAALADGVVELAREMGGGEIRIEAAGGIEDGALGTDAARVHEAVERVRSPDGVLVLMDLGSALMSAEMAVEMADPAGGPILLSEAPLVEGAVAAAARARGGGALGEVAREARGALAMKSTQLGGDAPEAAPERPAHEGEEVEELRLVVNNRLGLHARPAARFVGALAGIEANIEVFNESRGRGPADGRSLTGLATLAVGQGDGIVVTAGGPGAADALAALRALASENFGDAEEPEEPAGDARGVDTRPADARAETPAAALSADTPAAAEPASPPRPGTRLRGVPASAGIAIGPARPLRPGVQMPPGAKSSTSSPGSTELTCQIDSVPTDSWKARACCYRRRSPES